MSAVIKSPTRYGLGPLDFDRFPPTPDFVLKRHRAPPRRPTAAETLRRLPLKSLVERQRINRDKFSQIARVWSQSRVHMATAKTVARAKGLTVDTRTGTDYSVQAVILDRDEYSMAPSNSFLARNQLLQPYAETIFYANHITANFSTRGHCGTGPEQGYNNAAPTTQSNLPSHLRFPAPQSDLNTFLLHKYWPAALYMSSVFQSWMNPGSWPLPLPYDTLSYYDPPGANDFRMSSNLSHSQYHPAPQATVQQHPTATDHESRPRGYPEAHTAQKCTVKTGEIRYFTSTGFREPLSFAYEQRKQPRSDTDADLHETGRVAVKRRRMEADVAHPASVSTRLEMEYESAWNTRRAPVNIPQQRHARHAHQANPTNRTSSPRRFHRR